MNYFIYRKKYNEFVRMTDGQLYLSSDAEDVLIELDQEWQEDTEPVLCCIKYDNFFDSENNYKTMYNIYINGKQEDCFTCNSNDEDGFWKELNSFAEDYVKNKGK